MGGGDFGTIQNRSGDINTVSESCKETSDVDGPLGRNKDLNQETGDLEDGSDPITDSTTIPYGKWTDGEGGKDQTHLQEGSDQLLENGVDAIASRQRRIWITENLQKPRHGLKTVQQSSIKIYELEMCSCNRGSLLYWNMAKVQPKHMAKHLTFFHTGVLRPGLMAVLVIAAIATILTKSTSTHTILRKTKCPGLRASLQESEGVESLYSSRLFPNPHTPSPHSLRYIPSFSNFALSRHGGCFRGIDVRCEKLKIGVGSPNTPRVIGYGRE